MNSFAAELGFVVASLLIVAAGLGVVVVKVVETITGHISAITARALNPMNADAEDAGPVKQTMVQEAVMSEGLRPPWEEWLEANLVVESLNKNGEEAAP